jgi:hypothetical protein
MDLAAIRAQLASLRQQESRETQNSKPNKHTYSFMGESTNAAELPLDGSVSNRMLSETLKAPMKPVKRSMRKKALGKQTLIGPSSTASVTGKRWSTVRISRMSNGTLGHLSSSELPVIKKRAKKMLTPVPKATEPSPQRDRERELERSYDSMRGSVVKLPNISRSPNAVTPSKSFDINPAAKRYYTPTKGTVITADEKSFGSGTGTG